ncbi:hypothetical protein LSCM1_02190 [Leishmania martiniquensis]|uniref:RNI-like protein n=1 Tax=Leishmania martiniquensis TaxID=1580590 RepID=A0A836GQP9_9TRYP|nr:hypothetical protein LSCM1_02190 [Leishmania martiniquensis]
MGACCSSGKDLPNAQTAPALANRQRGKRSAADHAASLASRALSGAATGAGAPAEEMRARARRRALQSLVESLRAGESTIPTMKWRRQYLKTPGIGPAVISAVSNHIRGLPEIISGPATAAPQPLAKRPKHCIRALDMRALRAGDDGFVEMMSALLDDTLIEKAIFAGNEITDDGVCRLVREMKVHRGMWTTVEGSSSDAAAAATVAGSVSRKGLPCTLKLLALTDNLITSDGIATFSTVAPLFLSLEQLEVGRGQSGGGGDVDDVRDTLSASNIRALSSYIQRTPTLVTFLYKGNGNYYARNGFTPEGLTAFVDAIVGHSALKALYLQECFSAKPEVVGPVTWQAPRGEKPAVADALEDSWAPEKLQLPMQALATALNAASSHLSTLALRFPLSDEAVQTLSNGIAQAPNLINLSLRGCDLSGKALGMIGGALRTNKALRLLDVSFQSNIVAHPAFLAELRSSSRRRMSLVSMVGCSAAEMAQQDLSNGISEIPSCEERQHPLLPIIRSLHMNRSLSQLVMLGVNISTDDIEELCACIERSGNHTLTQVWYTHAGSDALDMKLEDFLASNRERGAGGSGAASGGISGYSSVGSTRSGAALPVNKSRPALFAAATVSENSDFSTKSATELNSTVRNTNTSVPHGAAPPSLYAPYAPPPNGSGSSAGNSEPPVEVMNGDPKKPSPSLESMQAIAKLNEDTNASARMMPSASPSEVAVSMVLSDSDASASPLSRTQRLNGRSKTFFSVFSGDVTDEAGPASGSPLVHQEQQTML